MAIHLKIILKSMGYNTLKLIHSINLKMQNS